jgi:hypothetical protein
VLSTELEDTVRRVSILASCHGILQPHLQRDSEQRIQAVNTQILLNESLWMRGEQSGKFKTPYMISHDCPRVEFSISHAIQLETGDLIFVSSDGFVDNFDN